MLLNCGVGEDSKEIQPVHPKGNQSWIFIGRTDVEAETPILWPPHAKSWLIWKDPDPGKDWGQEENGMTEDEVVGWTWVWVNSRSWWWTGKLGVLQFMGSQKSGHNWAIELNWNWHFKKNVFYWRIVDLNIVLVNWQFCLIPLFNSHR